MAIINLPVFRNFPQWQKIINANLDYIASVISGGGGAPTTAQYLTGAADAGLSAERVVTDTATISWDLATPGQAKANVPNLSGINTGDQTITLTGDVTGGGTGSFAVTVAAGAITNAKLANEVRAQIMARLNVGW